MSTRAKFQAIVIGHACGDTLGYQVEFSRLDAIRRRFGPEGVLDFQKGAVYSDDTQMNEALALGLLDSLPKSGDSLEVTVGDGDVRVERKDPESWLGYMSDPAHVMPHIAKRFVAWSISPENNRAPGGTCMAGCSALRRGVWWTESGVKNSKGCGSVMRSAPVGMVYLEPALGEIARASSVVTHGHPAALDAAHLGALAVRLLLEQEPVENLCALLYEHATDENMKALLMRVPLAVEATIAGRFTAGQIQTHRDAGPLSLGESWVGDEALVSALYCFLLAHARGEGYVETVRYGANTDGDSDSIAAIAGQFAGACWGLGGKKGVPVSWITRVERGAELRKLGSDLYDLHCALYGKAVEV